MNSILEELLLKAIGNLVSPEDIRELEHKIKTELVTYLRHQVGDTKTKLDDFVVELVAEAFGVDKPLPVKELVQGKSDPVTPPVAEPVAAKSEKADKPK